MVALKEVHIQYLVLFDLIYVYCELSNVIYYLYKYFMDIQEYGMSNAAIKLEESITRYNK